MRVKFYILVLLSSFVLQGPFVFAEDVPDVLLHQKASELYGKSIYTVLVDWHLRSRDEAKLIADSFVKNSCDQWGISCGDFAKGEVLVDVFDNYLWMDGAGLYKQYYHKIPVFSGSLEIQMNRRGVVYKLKNELVPNISAPTVPKISGDEVIGVLKKKYAQEKLVFIQEPKLYIFDNRLVWHVNIRHPVGEEAFIDSQNGEIVKRWRNGPGPLLAL